VPPGPGQQTRWWWRPRVRSALVLAVLVFVVLLARIAAHVETDWLWFDELGQKQVFWTLLTAKWMSSSLAALATTTLLLANFWIVERTAPSATRLARGDPTSGRLRRIAVPAYLALSAAAGFLVGRNVAHASWQEIVLWLHRRDFGVTDPLFHKDVGFFVFSLPLYQKVAHWLFLILAVALVCSFVGHVASGAIRTKPSPISATRGAHAHLLVLAALLLLVTAWQHWLGQYALELTRTNRSLPGAGYTEVHVLLPWLRVLIVVCLAGAALLVYAAVRRSWSLPAIVVVMVAVAELVNPSILPTVVQRIAVDPQTLSRERAYITDSVRMTQRAWALNNVAERPIPADASISEDELRSNRDVLRNIQLWDSDILKAEIDQQQSIGSYYAFPHITLDRYYRNGKPHAIMVAERELDLGPLDPSGRTWANDHLAYTHGYGVVAVPAGGVDEGGKPTFLTSEFGRGRPPTQLRQPRVYYGVQPPGAEPWVIVKTGRDEVEKPLSGDTPAPHYHYGGHGIQLSGVLDRALFALRFGELNLLLSETLNGQSRILLHRDVGERLQHLAPFLHWERRPAVTVVDGRIQFLAHGYTTSDSYPYSAHVEAGGTEVNYMRGSVVATVDAFSGRVRVYATDESDPIMQAWRAAFPTMFTPRAQMPASLRAHLRYPQELFDAQSKIWATYHIDNIDDFYSKSDAWKRPADISGPVQKFGTLGDRVGGNNPTLRPGFVLARLPGKREQQFMLTTMFTPYGAENLSGYLAGTLDPSGRPRLTQLSLPRSRRVLGPGQVTRQILASPGVSDRLRLLNQETTDLGSRAVNTVALSQPRVLPIGDSLLYVQTIYVTAQGTGVTKLRLVTVYLNGRVGYGSTLDKALERARS
jgi:uncharacterized membrane protein (UPF0182 family)